MPQIPKFSAEDTTLPTLRPDGTISNVVVPKGSALVLDATGVHYNRECYQVIIGSVYMERMIARCWPDPMAYKPSRFVGDWPKDAFIPFSSGMACLIFFSEQELILACFLGARACLGRRCVSPAVTSFGY